MGQKLSKIMYMSKCTSILPFDLNDSLAIDENEGSQIFALSTPKDTLFCLLASAVADEKFTVNSIIGPL